MDVGTTFTVSVSYEKAQSVDYTDCGWCQDGGSGSCSIKLIGNQGNYQWETTCGVAPPAAPTCGLPDPLPVNSCQKEAITDTNPNDDLCCSPIGIKLSATDQFINEDYIECGVQLSCDRPGVPCHDACEQRRIELVQREVGINLAHPYLYEIWSYSSDSLKGFFNIFRPKTKEEFEPLDAYSAISYGYIPGSAVPAQGKFYFPYLGGVQKAKEWVLKQLNP